MNSWEPENWSERLTAVVRFLENSGYVARLERLEEYSANVVVEGGYTYFLTAEGKLMTAVGGFVSSYGVKGRASAGRRHFQSGKWESIGGAIVGDLQLRAASRATWDRRQAFEKANVKPVEHELMGLCDNIHGITEGDVTVQGISTVVAGKRTAEFALNIDLTLSPEKIRAVLALLTQLNADMPVQKREFEDVAS